MLFRSFFPDLCGRLAENFPPFDERLAINEDGVVGNKAVHEKIMDLGPDWQRLDALVQHRSFRSLISGITGISDLQYDPHCRAIRHRTAGSQNCGIEQSYQGS